MARRERAFRGISARLARHYLEKLGGTVVDDGSDADGSDADGDGDFPGHAGTVEGEGWTVTLSTDTVEVGPVLELTEVTVVFEGDEEAAVGDIEERFAKKAMRAGG